MRSLSVIGLVLALTLPTQAQEVFKIDANHANIVWSASHFGFSRPSGRFAVAEGRFTLDEKQPQNSSVTVTVDTSSLMTGIPKFDEHLKSADFLDVAKFPKAVFTSERVEVLSEKTANIIGTLSLHGVTKPLTLKATLNKIGMNPANDKRTAGFSAEGVLKRSEHGVVYALPGVSDEVTLRIEVEGQAVAP